MSTPPDESAVAVIGMAGRFPGAEDVEEFWQNLRDGKESIRFLSDEELLSRGLDPALLEDPSHVAAVAELARPDAFDARFFGFSHREAEILDPQQRVFLECAWQALENAGYGPLGTGEPIGLFAGATTSTYLMFHLLPNAGAYDPLELLIANAGDSLATRVSYKLNLRGPSFTVQCACSTSLVAVHLACESLLAEACDMALAGAVSINVGQRTGYRYREESIFSPDGHCRAFDAMGRGTVFGSGGGIVVLKRLGDALADSDTIRGVVLGSAVNNDGSLKAGYTAPSVEGQAQVIGEALAVAGVEADSISYVEAHGTATSLGDPIEVEALTRAFRSSTERQGFCALGSVKTNIGHLDVAAGVSGLIKTLLALEHRQIPPSLHFETPNPEIDFAGSPVYVASELRGWESAAGTPRRAGVSSFGVGGTNAHVIVEEAPAVEPSGPSRPWQLVVLSAKTRPALEEATARLAAHLERHPALDTGDVAYTLSVGRKAFGHRRILLCRDSVDAAAALSGREEERLLSRSDKLEPGDRPVVFMFPGQGAQYVNMGRELYQSEASFRADVDRCARRLEPLLGFDLASVLYPSPEEEEKARRRLERTAVTQPALYVVEVALGRLWIEWGVAPQAMIGHSIGEYAAACLAGVFSLDDGLALVAARGRLMEEMPAGAMLSVPLPAAEVEPLLGRELSLAAVNAPSLSTLAGPGEAIAALARRLAERGVESRPLHTSHAFHSALMEPVVERFTAEVERIALRAPEIPYLSNLTGTWITAEEATDPSYWARHLRHTVRFAEGMAELAGEPERIFLEVGPGRTLGTLARQQLDERDVVTSMRHPRDTDATDVAVLLTALGRLWLAGRQIEWPRFFAGQRRRRVPLPGYPFERHSYWLGPGMPTSAAASAGETPGELYDRPQLETGYLAPRDEIEAQVATLWQELLGVARVGVHDNFFELGGHSLLATQLLSRLRDVLHVELVLEDLFEKPSVAGLAQTVTARLAASPGPAPSAVPLERISRQGELPLSFSQERLWFLVEFEPGTPAYNLAEAVRLTGRLDVAALAASLGEVLRRHEALRTTFQAVSGRPVQVILPELKPALPEVDLRRLASSHRAAEARRRAAEAAAAPFDLSRGPLLKTLLLRLGEEEHVFVLNIHHIVFDRWSMGRLLGELPLLYDAFLHRLGTPLAEPSLQYVDFAAWQKRWLQGEVLESRLAFWRRELQGAPPVLRLPTDRPRPAVRTDRGAKHGFAVPGELADGLRKLGREHGVTLFMTLLAAVNVLLHRMTGQRDFCVGTFIANRNRAELEELIGFFVNTLTLRTAFAGDPGFADLLRRVRGTTLGAYAHQDLPFEKLLEELEVERVMSYSPLFQVMLVFQNTPAPALELPGLDVRRLEIEGGVWANVDWTLWIWEAGGGDLAGYIDYNTDLFESTTILRLLRHFQTLLRGLVGKPGSRLSTLPLLSPPERHQLLLSWNDTRQADGAAVCVHHLFEAQAESRGDAVALVFDDVELTYEQLNRRANQLAGYLQTQGVGPEVLVGLSMERCPEMIIALLGILKAGGAYLPLDPGYPPERLTLMMDDAGISLLLSRRGDPSAEYRTRLVALDVLSEALAQESEENPAGTVSGDHLAYVIYTSGSTGRPKGVRITHASLVGYTLEVCETYGLAADDRVLQFASISFDAAVEQIYPCLVRGATLVLRTDSMLDSVESFVDECRDHRLTVMDLPTAYWHELTAKLSARRAALPEALRLVTIGGEKALDEPLAAWRRCVGGRVRLLNTYGPTETTVVATRCDLTAPAPDAERGREVSIGRPITNVRAYVLDPGSRPVPLGAPGQLLIGGAGLARGYLDRPSLTAEKFSPDPFSRKPGTRLYQTGDRVRSFADGRLEFLGRIDHQVKVRGFRIEPGEVEAHLTRHPAVRESVVVVRDDTLVAYVVAEPETAPTSGELRRFLEERLPAYMVPSTFVTLLALPLSPLGKVDRRRLPAPERDRPELEHGFKPPETPVEEALAEIYEQIVGLDKIGVNDSFFELGGHSLLATQAVSRIHETFEIELSLRTFFESPSIAELAVKVEEELITRLEGLSKEEIEGLL